MRYAISKYKKEQEEMAYRIYMTDSLYYRAQNQYMNVRYYDLLNRKIDNRSGDEIATDVIHKIGLRLIG